MPSRSPPGGRPAVEAERGCGPPGLSGATTKCPADLPASRCSGEAGFFVPAQPPPGGPGERYPVRRPRPAPPRRPRGAARAAARCPRRAHPGPRRRHRHRPPGRPPDRRRLRRPRPRGLQREPLRHPAGRRRRGPRGLPRRRRRRRRDRHASAARRWSSPSTAWRTARSSSTAPRPRSPARPAPRHDTPERPRFVCGSMGPTTRAISVTGGVTFDELIETLPRPGAGADGRRRRLPAARDLPGHPQRQGRRSMGIEAAFDAAGWRLPVAVSATIEATGTMLAGQDAEALAVSLLARRPALRRPQLRHRSGPHDRPPAHALRALPHPRRLRAQRRPAGRGGPLPRGAGGLRPRPSRASSTPAGSTSSAAAAARPAAHVAALAGLVAGRRAAPRPAPPAVARSPASRRSSSTGDNRPLLVGERTNVLGSRKFKRAHRRPASCEAAAEVGRAQVRAGRAGPRRLPAGPRPRRDGRRRPPSSTASCGWSRCRS